MAAYKLITNGALRVADQAHIPNDSGNADWQTYQAWLAAGNTPDAADVVVAPVAKPDPTAWLERLSPSKQLAITTAAVANPALLLWLLKASGKSTIDVTAPEAIAGVGALVTAGVLTADEQAVMLAP